MLRKIMAMSILGTSLIFGGFSSPPAQATDTEEEFTLEEITVTAEKREANIQSTAISVTALTGSDITEKSLLTLDNILGNVPAVVVQGSTTGKQIYLRGIGSNVSTNQSDPAVAVIIDNVYAGRSEVPLTDVYDLERIEVLRGPQGTLYGRNAEGGIVNVVTSVPKDRFELLSNFRLGDYNLKHLDGAINMPFSNNIAARIAFLRETRDGYLSDGGMNSDRFSARGKLSYKPNEKLSFLATIDYSVDNSFNVATVPTPGSAGKLPPMPWNDNIGTEGWALPEGSDPWTNDEYHYGKARLTQTLYSLEVSYDMGWGQIKLIPTYTKHSRFTLGELFMGTGMGDGTLDGQTRNFDQWTGEITLTSAEDSPIKWIGGYYFLKSNYNEDRGVTDPLDYGDSNWHYVTYNHPAKTGAYFGQATYPVNDRWNLTAGIRRSIDNRSMDYRYANANVPTDDPMYAYTNGTGVYDSGRLRYEDKAPTTTYKAGVDFNPSEDSMLYAQISTGFKQGGLNMTAPPKAFSPEELLAYEIGSKNRFFSGRMQINMELFYYDYDKFQITVANETSIGESGELEQAMMIINADKTTHKGGEIEMDYLFTVNDLLKMNMSYLDARYGKLIIPANPMMGLPEAYPLTGTQVANSPKWTGSLGYQHTWTLDNGDGVTFNISTKLSSGYYTTVEKWQASPWQDSYHRSDASVNYQSADGKWTVGVWSKNLENKAQTTVALPFYRRIITDPRTVGVNISFKY